MMLGVYMRSLLFGFFIAGCLSTSVIAIAIDNDDYYSQDVSRAVEAAKKHPTNYGSQTKRYSRSTPKSIQLQHLENTEMEDALVETPALPFEPASTSQQAKAANSDDTKYKDIKIISTPDSMRIVSPTEKINIIPPSPVSASQGSAPLPTP